MPAPFTATSLECDPAVGFDRSHRATNGEEWFGHGGRRRSVRRSAPTGVAPRSPSHRGSRPAGAAGGLAGRACRPLTSIARQPSAALHGRDDVRLARGTFRPRDASLTDRGRCHDIARPKRYQPSSAKPHRKPGHWCRTATIQPIHTLRFVPRPTSPATAPAIHGCSLLSSARPRSTPLDRPSGRHVDATIHRAASLHSAPRTASGRVRSG